MTDPWVRIAHQAVTGGDTAGSVAFAQSAPLDDTHLLVAVVSATGTAGSRIPALSWSGATLVWGALVGITWTGVYTLRADGVTNGLDCDWSGQTLTRHHITLMAFAGYVQQAAMHVTADTTNQAAGLSATVALSAPTDAAPAVAIALIGLQNFVPSITAFDGGFVNAPRIGGEAAHSAVLALPDAGVTPSAATSWSVSRQYRRVMVVMHASPPPVPPAPTNIGVWWGDRSVAARYLDDQPVIARHLGPDQLWP